MPKVNTNSNLISTSGPDAVRPDPHKARGRLVEMVGTVDNAGTDETASTYHLGNVPSNAIVHEHTFFGVASWGFAQVVIGTASDTDALVDQAKTTEAIVTPFEAGDGFHGKAWWEALGLASDPGGFIGIYAHAEANAAAAGSMNFRFAYLQAD